MLPNLLFVYRSGGDYDREDVANMKWQLNKFITIPHNVVCMSNDPLVADVPLTTNLNRWWCKVEMFKNNSGPFIYLDLDVVIIRNIDKLISFVCCLNSNQFMMMTPCSEIVEVEEAYSSSIMGWTGDYKFLFDNFKPEDLSYRGDQTYITHQLRAVNTNFKFAPHVVPIHGWNSKCSYGIPDDTCMINFFGNPRPRHLGLPYWGRHLI